MLQLGLSVQWIKPRISVVQIDYTVYEKACKEYQFNLKIAKHLDTKYNGQFDLNYLVTRTSK